MKFVNDIMIYNSFIKFKCSMKSYIFYINVKPVLDISFPLCTDVQPDKI